MPPNLLTKSTLEQNQLTTEQIALINTQIKIGISDKYPLTCLTKQCLTPNNSLSKGKVIEISIIRTIKEIRETCKKEMGILIITTTFNPSITIKITTKLITQAITSMRVKPLQ